MDKEMIFDEYGALVYKYLLSLTKNPQLSEDLTQETFYQALKSLHRYDSTKGVKFCYPFIIY